MNSLKGLDYFLRKIKDETLELGDKIENNDTISIKEIEYLGQKISILIENYYNSEYLNEYNSIISAYQNIKQNYEKGNAIESDLATICMVTSELIDRINSFLPIPIKNNKTF